MSEADVQKAVISHMRLRARAGVWWCHLNNNSANMIQGKRNKALGVTKGAPDLMFVAEGRALFLELKAIKGRVAPAQTAAHVELRRAGAECVVAHGLDEALRVIGGWGLFSGGAACG